MASIDLNDKVAIVTGGAGGIGGATVRLLAERGAHVVIADISEARADALAQELRDAGRQALAIGFDLAEEESIKALITRTAAELGRIDILVNNAALLTPEISAVDQDVGSIPTWAWDATFNANCRGTMIATREALPHLLETRGNIVNVVSGLALQGHVIQVAYAASKAAIIQLTRSTAASHSRRGVRCNAVAPGLTLTPVVAQHFPKALLDLTAAETLRDRLGTAEDLAEVIAFLASDAARHVTAQVVVADGGHTSHIPAMSFMIEATAQPA